MNQTINMIKCVYCKRHIVEGKEICEECEPKYQLDLAIITMYQATKILKETDKQILLEKKTIIEDILVDLLEIQENMNELSRVSNRSTETSQS